MDRSRFPRRGRAMTRLETFTDAAFAFAAALLAISIDDVPSTYPALIEALKGAPACAASLGIILMFWHAHQRWSDRYGLEDLPSVLLTFALIMVVMIYVYPLKIMFQSGFSFFSNGWFPSGFDLETHFQFKVLVTLYGIGFFALCGLIAALYGYAWHRRAVLEMQPEEAFDTIAESLAWLFVASFGLLSIVLAWTLPEALLPLAPSIYALLAVFGPLIGVVQNRRARKRFGQP